MSRFMALCCSSALVVLAACEPPTPEPHVVLDLAGFGVNTGCGKDTDCKGVRICVQSVCVDPPVTPDAAMPLVDLRSSDLAGGDAGVVDMQTPADLSIGDAAGLDDGGHGDLAKTCPNIPFIALCDNACVDTRIDIRHCGGCGMACPPVANGAPNCVGGHCGFGVCLDGYADCKNGLADGCETRIAGDIDNCGACNVACTRVPNASTQCLNGTCSIGMCNPGYADCANGLADGCETNLHTDVNNCGACNRACPGIANGAAGCANDVCGIGACNPGYADCGSGAADGCETHVAVDVKNCGACGMACPALANATAACANGTCGIGQCSPGFADCNSDPSDGCETRVSDDATNCGACDLVCPATPNSTPVCANSACGFGSCNQGYDDCNHKPADGCETMIAVDANNCGVCGKICPSIANGTRACANGACGVGACSQGYADCNGKAGDGCEVNTDSDPANCGSCGVACPKGNCTAGACI